ncbi:MAG: hypothetical protein ACQER0_04350, partial [Bacillota bacterium]
TENKLVFKIDKLVNNYQQEFKEYKLIFNNLDSYPQKVYLDGKEVNDFSYFDKTLELKVSVLINEISIELV